MTRRVSSRDRSWPRSNRSAITRTRAEPEAGEHSKHEHDAPPIRLIVALALAAPLVLLAMVPPLQFSGWGWVSLALATPAVFWSGAQFHRVAC